MNLSKRLSHLVMHEAAVTVHFTDKSTVDAKVVVGADGCFSKVRQQTLADGSPDYSVSACFSCMMHRAISMRPSHGWTSTGPPTATSKLLGLDMRYLLPLVEFKRHRDMKGLDAN